MSHLPIFFAFLDVVNKMMLGESLVQNWTRKSYFKNKTLNFKIRPSLLTLARHWVKCKNVCYHRILRPKCPAKNVSCDTRGLFSFSPHLDVDLCLEPESLLIWLVIPQEALLRSLGSQLSLVWSRQSRRRNDVRFVL